MFLNWKENMEIEIELDDKLIIEDIGNKIDNGELIENDT